MEIEMEMGYIVCSIFLGIIGSGFLLYGKKQQAVVPLCVGVGLCIVPYFITNIYLLTVAGIGLIILPYYVKV